MTAGAAAERPGTARLRRRPPGPREGGLLRAKRGRAEPRRVPVQTARRPRSTRLPGPAARDSGRTSSAPLPGPAAPRPARVPSGERDAALPRCGRAVPESGSAGGRKATGGAAARRDTPRAPPRTRAPPRARPGNGHRPRQPPRRVPRPAGARAAGGRAVLRRSRRPRSPLRHRTCAPGTAGSAGPAAKSSSASRRAERSARRKSVPARGSSTRQRSWRAAGRESSPQRFQLSTV